MNTKQRVLLSLIAALILGSAAVLVLRQRSANQPPASPEPSSAPRPTPELARVPKKTAAPAEALVPREAKADLIASVVLDPEKPCAGDDVLVTVKTKLNANDEARLNLMINNRRGNPVAVKLKHAGDYLILVRALTPEGLQDARTVEIVAEQCEDRGRLSVSARPARDRTTFYFFARPSVSGDYRYRWSFGDGSSLETEVPYAEHAFGAHADPSKRTSSFVVEVEAIGSSATLKARTTVHIHSRYLENLERFGVITPRVLAGRATRTPTGFTAAIELQNPGELPLSFQRASVEMVPCHGAPEVAPRELDASALLSRTRLEARESIAATLALAQELIPPGVCRVVIDLHGAADDSAVPVIAVAGLDLQPKIERWLNAGDHSKLREVERAFEILGRDPRHQTVTDRELEELRVAGLLPVESR